MFHLPSVQLIVDTFLQEVDVTTLDIEELRISIREHIRQKFLPFYINIIDSMPIMRQIFQEICRKGNWILQTPDKKQYAIYSYQHGIDKISKYFYPVEVDPINFFVGYIDGTHVYYKDELLFYMIPRN